MRPESRNRNGYKSIPLEDAIKWSGVALTIPILMDVFGFDEDHLEELDTFMRYKLGNERKASILVQGGVFEDQETAWYHLCCLKRWMDGVQMERSESDNICHCEADSGTHPTFLLDASMVAKR